MSIHNLWELLELLTNVTTVMKKQTYRLKAVKLVSFVIKFLSSPCFYGEPITLTLSQT